MASNVRFADQLSVSAFGNIGGVNAVSSSYAETASFADFATSASYAVSASHEITKEVSSSYADTASFAQSGNGIFSGSFSGSYEGNGSGLTSIPASGIIGLPVVSGTTDTIPIFTSANGIGDSVITYDGESFIADLPGGFFSIKQSGGDYVRIFPSQNLISTDGNFLILEGSKGVTLNDDSGTATYTGGALELVSGGGDQIIIRNNGDIEVTPDGGGLMKIQFPTNGLAYTYSLPTASGTIALTSDLSGYLPLSGGTLTGAIVVEDNTYIEFGSANATWQFEKNSATGYLEITNTDEGYVTALFDQEAFFTSKLYVEERIVFTQGGYGANQSGQIIPPVSVANNAYYLPDATGTIALLNNSGSGLFKATGSFTGSFIGDGSQLTGISHPTSSISSSYALTASYVETAQTASYVLNAVSSSYSTTSSYAFNAVSSSYALTASYAVSASHEIIHELSSSYAETASFAQSGNGIFSGSFSGSFEGNGSGLTDIPATGIIGLNLSQIASGSSTASISPNGGLFVNTNITASGNISASGFISASYFVGDGSQLINVVSSSYALTASYVETSQTASYVLNAISSSYALTASYAVSASHEIIKEVSSSYADTASFAQSGNGLFSGSFSGSYVGDGSGLTGVDPFPFSGSAVITGSLLVSGSSKPLEIIGSGSTVFSVQGSLGELFAIDDVLSGSLLVINDAAGDPQFEIFSDGRTLIGADPRSLYTTATINATLAATSESIYSLSTSSYDGVFFDYTASSASNARAGNIMSIWNGGNLVYTENTTTDIGSTVGVTFNVEISQSQAQLISLTDTAGWKIKTTIRSI